MSVRISYVTKMCHGNPEKWNSEQSNEDDPVVLPDDASFDLGFDCGGVERSIVAPPIQMGFSLDEHSSNHRVILEQLWCPICLMIVSQPLELGATM
ncbi:hypothetical protein EMCRGX_G019441 [Ephydatia muelleri]